MHMSAEKVSHGSLSHMVLWRLRVVPRTLPGRILVGCPSLLHYLFGVHGHLNAVLPLELADEQVVFGWVVGSSCAYHDVM